MNNYRVGIVEDDAIIAMSIAKDLRELGYHPMEACGDYEAGVEMAIQEKPDLLLLDIMLGGRKDGIDVAMAVKPMGIPIIFITANSDAATLARAKEATPAAYLIKPFGKADLHATIEIAMHNAQDKAPAPHVPQYRLEDTVFIRQGQYLRKITYEDIFYLESDNTYLYIHTSDRKFVVRESLAGYLIYLGSAIFCRIHRSYAINLQKLEAIHADHVIVDGKELPVGKQYRAELLRAMRIS